jgi:dipeptidyl aminopeptidase/acylaminoacyl peptidase
MKKTPWLSALAVLVLAASPLFSAAPETKARRALALDDLSRLKFVSDPQPSPDGKWIAYTLATTDTEKDKRQTDIWMVSRDGSQELQLTFGPDSESMPRWSPDGRYLSFLAARGTEEEKKQGAQVWLLNRSGGEASRLTSLKGGVSFYAWSPDGRRLVLGSQDVNPADEPEKMEGWKRKTRPPIVIDRYHFKQDREGYLQRFYTHLWLFDLETRKAEALTTDAFDDRSPVWSPDGRRIAFVSRRGPDPDRTEGTDIFVIEAGLGAKPIQLTSFAGPDSDPSWSPDGSRIAYLTGDEPRFGAYNLNRVAVLPAEGGAPVVLTQALDRSAEGRLRWSPDGKTIFFVFDDDRASVVGRVPAAGGTVERLTAGRRTLSSLSLTADGALVFLSGTADEMNEISTLENGVWRRLTHQNDTLLAELELGTTEDFSSRSQDGTEVHGLLVKPAAFAAGRRYPTLLLIHGGPNGQDQYSFSFDRQFFAAHGYVVLAVNYRGSSGRGSAYQKAIFADWGHKEVIDLLGAVDQAVALGVADPDRLGLGGWSYGGILTDYTIATTPRFKAAVSGAGSALQLSMFGVDQYIVQYEKEIGVPWKAKDLWLKISYPFFRADRIRTPTLFLGGEKDFNVPLVGGEQMYQALKSLGVDTRLVIYPGQFHGLSVPSYQRDRLERYLAWFDKYLKIRK